MKRLLLLRHAHAVRNHPPLDDINRPLSERGHEDAALVADFLKSEGLIPDYVACSVARRAQETLAGLGRALDQELAAAIKDDLYNASPENLFAAAMSAPAEAQSAMVIAHNPGMEMLARALVSAESDAKALVALMSDYPSAGLAILEFQVDGWPDLQPRQGDLRFFKMPKDFH